MAKKSKLPVEKLTASKVVIKTNAVETAPSEKCYPSPSDSARERKYKAEDALRTINEYNKVKSDKGLMSDVKKLAKEQIKTLSKVGK